MASEVTGLLQRLREGDESVRDELVSLVYAELRRVAQAFMHRQKPGHTLQPTALVNEAFLKLFESDTPPAIDRGHFLALMSRIMRQVLVDHARGRGTAKRGGGDARVEWDTNIQVADETGVEQVALLDLDRALDALDQENHEIAEVVTMHYFGGMTAEEVAAAVGRSVHVVRHDLRFGRAWLRRRLESAGT